MVRSLEDPTFAGRVEAVERRPRLPGRVRRPGRAATYRVKVFEYPDVRRADARLDFPGYTGLETKIAEDIRHVSAVEGTDLALTCLLNKEVATARLVDEKGEATALVPADPRRGDHAYLASFRLAESHRYKLELVDADGRKNKAPTDLAVNVTRNRPATVVKVTRPAATSGSRRSRS